MQLIQIHTFLSASNLPTFPRQRDREREEETVGGGGDLKKMYVDVPSGLRNIDSFYTYSWHILPPINIPFFQFYPKWMLFYHISPKYTQFMKFGCFCLGWKSNHWYTKITENMLQNAGTCMYTTIWWVPHLRRDSLQVQCTCIHDIISVQIFVQTIRSTIKYELGRNPNICIFTIELCVRWVEDVDNVCVCILS